MARKKKKDDDKASIEYMLTYGDMVTLLLCFFVMLLTMATFEPPKVQLILSAFRGALGVLERGPSMTEFDMMTMGIQAEKIIKGFPELVAGRQDKEGRRRKSVRTKIQQALGKAFRKGGAYVRTDERGIIIQIANTTLFEGGSAEIKTEAEVILDKTGELLSLIPNQIKIEGHTDDIPIESKEYPSNWELSVMRATNVLRYIDSKYRGMSDRLSASGYGMYRPIVPNISPENRAKNRRVDIVIIQKPVDEEDEEIENLD
ncbi:MAG: flagellar motor protein MotB [bacterium]|nr:flagellar motor protein MotB [bacterium]